MRYDIRLIVEYRYPAASDHVRNLLRLVPVDDPRQSICSTRLTIFPPPDEQIEGHDFFGNRVTRVAWARPVDRTSFTLRATAVRRAMDAPDTPSLAQIIETLPAQGLGPLSPLHFLGPSPRIRPVPEFGSFARRHASGTDRLADTVAAIGQALHRHMRFDASATDATTAPETAFAQRRGVCQDYAQIMVGALRSLGLPAGYVSGFLRTTPPPGRPRLEGVDAMHGWVMIWAGPEAGWLEYDPTNAQWAAEDYISIAKGRDYGDVAPVRGAIRTSGGQESGHRVDVIPRPETARRDDG